MDVHLTKQIGEYFAGVVLGNWRLVCIFETGDGGAYDSKQKKRKQIRPTVAKTKPS